MKRYEVLVDHKLHWIMASSEYDAASKANKFKEPWIAEVSQRVYMTTGARIIVGDPLTDEVAKSHFAMWKKVPLTLLELEEAFLGVEFWAKDNSSLGKAVTTYTCWTQDNGRALCACRYMGDTVSHETQDLINYFRGMLHG